MSNCNQLEEGTIKRAIREHKRSPRSSDDKPGRCMFCKGQVGYSFVVIADGVVTRIAEGAEHYPMLMRRWDALQKDGTPITEAPNTIVMPVNACSRAIKLMDDVDREDILTAIDRERQKRVTDREEVAKPAKWYQS